MATRKECAPIFKIIKAATLPTSCKEMLITALPTALTPVEDRHPYEGKIVEAVSQIFSAAETSKTKAVSDLSTQISELSDKLGKSKESATSAREDATAKKAAADAKQPEVTEAEKLLNETTAGAQSQKDKAAEFAKKIAENAAAVEAWKTVIAERYEKLKASELKSHEKTRGMKELFKALEPVSLDESLHDTLHVVLKAKATDRGVFSNDTLGFAEKVFALHLESLEKAVADITAESDEHNKSLVEVDAQIEAATGKLKEKQDELKVMSDSWVDADNAASNMEAEVSETQSSIEKAEKDLEKAKKLLEDFTEVANSYTALAQRSKVVPEAVPEEEVASANDAEKEAEAVEPSPKRAKTDSAEGAEEAPVPEPAEKKADDTVAMES